MAWAVGDKEGYFRSHSNSLWCNSAGPENRDFIGMNRNTFAIIRAVNVAYSNLGRIAQMHGGAMRPRESRSDPGSF